MYTESSGAEFQQGDLFGGKPKKRTRRRGWTELDRLRRRSERADRRIVETGGDDKELEAAADAEQRLILREEEARERWRKSFGS